ncbi:MAG TPA: hypothetical protein VHB68_16350 [Steroidobacteraceae bacterium]|nr:hypothetical protein [Steroidobacteraceae bacterium]
MLNAILSVGLAGALLAGLIAWIRTQTPRYHDITAAEIHPDLTAGEDLLQDAIEELQRLESQPQHRPDEP